jgi:tetratricopeptide (TPR) repeat protein
MKFTDKFNFSTIVFFCVLSCSVGWSDLEAVPFDEDNPSSAPDVNVAVVSETEMSNALAELYFLSGQYDLAEIGYRSFLKGKPEDGGVIGNLGIIYFEQNRLRFAMPFLVKARELNPHNLAVRSKLGSAYLIGRQFEKAKEEALFILENGSGNPLAPMLLVAASVTEADIAETQETLDTLHTDDPSSATIKVALGNLALKNGDIESAQKYCEEALRLDGESYLAQFSLGRIHHMRGNLSESEKYFKAAADMAPLRSPQTLAYASFKIQQGDLDEAKKFLESVIAEAPDYLPGLQALAQISVRENKLEEAYTWIEKINVRDGAYPDALILGSQIKLKLGEKQQALKISTHAVSQFPKLDSVHYQQALAYLSLDMHEEAVLSLNRVLLINPNSGQASSLLTSTITQNKNPEESIRALQEFLEGHPDMVWVRLSLANAFRDNGNFDEALALYAELEELSPQSPLIHLNRSLVFRLSQKRSQARSEILKALTINPDYLPAAIDLIHLDLEEQKMSEARSRTDRLLSEHSESIDVHLLNGRVSLAENDLRSAQQSFLQVIEMGGYRREAYMFLAQISMREGNYEETLGSLGSILEEDENDLESLMLSAMVSQGLNRLEKASRFYERLIVLKPDHPPALNNLAVLYSNNENKLDSAYEYARQARGLDPENPQIADTLGWILYKKGEYEKALVLAEESALKLPKSGETLYHLGMCQLATGDKGRALSSFEAALRLGNEFDGIEDCRTQAEKLKAAP